MARERRRGRQPHEPDRRYGDRRLALGFRTLVEGLVEKGEVEVVDSPWGREFVPKPPDEPEPSPAAPPEPPAPAPPAPG
jgi:hypothetical protein